MDPNSDEIRNAVSTKPVVGVIGVEEAEAAHLADISQGTHVRAIADKQGTSAAKVHSSGGEVAQTAEFSL